MTLVNCIMRELVIYFTLFNSVTASPIAGIKIDNIYITMKPPEEMNYPEPANKAVTPVLGNKKCNNQNGLERSTLYIQHDKYKTPKWYEMHSTKNGVKYSETNVNVNELADMPRNLFKSDYFYPGPYLKNNNVISRVFESPPKLGPPEVYRKGFHSKPNRSRLFTPLSKSSNVENYFTSSMFIPAQQLLRKNSKTLNMIAKLVSPRTQDEARKGYSDLQLLQKIKPPSKPYDGLYDKLFKDLFHRYYVNDPTWNERESDVNFMVTSKPTPYDYNSRNSNLDYRHRNQPSITLTTSPPSSAYYYDYEFNNLKDNIPYVRKYNQQIMDPNSDQSIPILKSSRTHCQCLGKRSEHNKDKPCLQKQHTCDCAKPEKKVADINKEENHYEKNTLYEILKDIEWISDKMSKNSAS